MFQLDLAKVKWRLKGWLPQEWRWQSDFFDSQHAGETDWLEVQVPGSVYPALAAAGLIPDPHDELNSRSCEWVAERDWMFECQFRPDDAQKALRFHELVIDGIDHYGHFFLNEHKLGEHRGLYEQAVFDVTDYLKFGEVNRLRIVVEAAPAGVPQIGFTEHVCHLKPRFTYKWDFTARLIELGIFQGIYLRSHDGRIIEDLWVRQSLAWKGPNLCHQAVLKVETRYTGNPARLVLSLLDGGTSVAEASVAFPATAVSNKAHLKLAVDTPNLWWPNGMGPQHLYRLRANLLDSRGALLDQREISVGLRQIDFYHLAETPADSLPYFCRINQRPLSIRGWNFVPVDQNYCNNNTEKYDWLLRLARNANVNLLRVWGGGLIETDHFYELCSRYGLLVWQEFPQSSSGLGNRPSHNPAFLGQLKKAASAQVKRKRNHTSLAIWCGGNELADQEMTPLTREDRNLDMLARVVRRLDPGRLFLPTSPTGPSFAMKEETLRQGLHHDVHGPWKYLGNPEHYRYYNTSDCMLHSEFGVDGMASVDSIAGFISAENRWPTGNDNPSYRHHGGVWWDHTARTRALFGEPSNLRDMVYASQFIQAEGLRYAVEANRRRPACAGSIIWQLNEPFPNATCTSAIDYYGRPKMAYYWVAKSYKPVHASLRYERLNWESGGEFRGECYIHNETSGTITGELTCAWHDLYGVRLGQKRLIVSVGPHSTSAGQAVTLTLPDLPLNLFCVTLLYRMEMAEVDNRYFFSTGMEPLFSGMLHLPPAELRVSPLNMAGKGSELKVANQGEAIALFAQIGTGETCAIPGLSDNFISLLPGEAATLRVSRGRARGVERAEPFSDLTLEAWNVPSRKLPAYMSPLVTERCSLG